MDIQRLINILQEKRRGALDDLAYNRADAYGKAIVEVSNFKRQLDFHVKGLQDNISLLTSELKEAEDRIKNLESDVEDWESEYETEEEKVKELQAELESIYEAAWVSLEPDNGREEEIVQKFSDLFKQKDYRKLEEMLGI